MVCAKPFRNAICFPVVIYGRDRRIPWSEFEYIWTTIQTVIIIEEQRETAVRRISEQYYRLNGSAPSLSILPIKDVSNHFKPNAIND